MKRSIATLILVLLTTTAVAQTGWFRLRPNVPGQFKDISFLSADKGFLLTNYPAKAFSTENGGTAWNEMSLPSCTNCIYHFYTIYFIDIKVGYITGYSYDGSTTIGALFKTTDAGKSWMKDESTAPHPFPFPAPSEKIGYAISQNHFNKTADSGKTWTLIDSISGSGSRYTAFDFRDENNVLTIKSTGEPAGYIPQVTTDGGKTWVYTQVSDNVNTSLEYIKALPDNVYLVGGYYGPIFRTGDNARTWSIVSSNSSGLFSFYDAKIGYTGGNFTGYVQRTTNGGMTWSIQNVDTLLLAVNKIRPKWIAISAPSELTAYAIANDTLLYKTIDGGIGSQSSVRQADQTHATFFLVENPVSQEAKFTFASSPSKRTIEVIDVLGKVVRSVEIPQGTTSLVFDLHGITPGLYICHIGLETIKMLVTQ